MFCDHIAFSLIEIVFPNRSIFKKSDLMNCHVIAAPSVDAMLKNFVSETQEGDKLQLRKSLKLNLVHIVLGIFHW